MIVGARGWLMILAFVLVGCSALPAENSQISSAPPDLETAAIASGVIPDPSGVDLTGLYARDADRICVVPDRVDFRIGIFVDYGDGQACSGAGTVAKDGETLKINLGAGNGCVFDARFEGDRIVLPGQLPQSCSALCVGRASVAALDVRRLSDSVSEAAALRDAGGKLLCGDPQ